jgi:hypothetical protein
MVSYLPFMNHEPESKATVKAHIYSAIFYGSILAAALAFASCSTDSSSRLPIRSSNHSLDEKVNFPIREYK